MHLAVENIARHRRYMPFAFLRLPVKKTTIASQAQQ